MTFNEPTLTALNRTLVQDPANIQALARRGALFHQAGRYPKALTDFSRLIDLKPDYAWVFAHRGESYCSLGRYPAALADFDRAIELEPAYLWAIAHRGTAYRLRGRPYFPQALADYNRALELKPDYAWALACRAELQLLTGHYPAALADFDRAIALDETLFGPYWRGGRGLVLIYDRRYAEAIAWYHQALAEQPDDFIARYGLALARTRSEGLVQARTELLLARTAAESKLETAYHDNALYRLAGLAALEGRFEAALTHLRQAITLSNEPAEVIRHDPAWDDLRTDPRFQALLV